jgi:hypothetical protein
MDAEHVLAIIIIAIAAIALTALALRYRTRVQYQMTVRAAIEKGQALTPEFLAGLTERPPPRTRNTVRDLRFGVVAIALGLGIASFGWIIGDDEVQRVMMGIGNVPFLIGIALVVLWRFQPRD